MSCTKLSIQNGTKEYKAFQESDNINTFFNLTYKS